MDLSSLSTNRLLALREQSAALKYSPDQPRDDHGRWTSGNEGDEWTDARVAYSEEWDRVGTETDEQGEGNCYEAAYTLMHEAPGLGLQHPKICQGVATGTGPIKGQKFGHAWLEADGPRLTLQGHTAQFRIAYDYSSGHRVALPADAYRSLGRISDVHEYSPLEAASKAISTGHYGPWAPTPKGTVFAND